MSKYLKNLHHSDRYHRLSIRSGCNCCCLCSYYNSNTNLPNTLNSLPHGAYFLIGAAEYCSHIWFARQLLSSSVGPKDCQKASCEIIVCLWYLPYYVVHHGYLCIFSLFKFLSALLLCIVSWHWRIVGMLSGCENFRKPLSSLSFQWKAVVVRAAQAAILEKGVPSSSPTLFSELCCVSQLFNLDICISSLVIFKLLCHWLWQFQGKTSS